MQAGDNISGANDSSSIGVSQSTFRPTDDTCSSTCTVTSTNPPPTAKPRRSALVRRSTYIKGTHEHPDLPEIDKPKPLGMRRKVTWSDDDTVERNPSTLPTELKMGGPCHRTTAEPKSYASWFQGSPMDLEERREAKREDEMWLKRVRKWKKEQKNRGAHSRYGWLDRLSKGLDNRLLECGR